MITAAYEAGESTYEIGKKMGWEAEKIRFWLKRWNVPRRPIGFQKGQRSPRWKGGAANTTETSRRWRKANPEKVRAGKRKQMLRREVRLANALRNRLNNAVRRNHKNGSAVADLGCSIVFFIEYIELQFSPGMTWDNWGREGSHWNLDHKRPLSSFDLTDRMQFLAACHYTNIQPLWATANAAKRDTFSGIASTTTAGNWDLPPRQRIEYGGIQDTMSGWAKRVGISAAALSGRLKLGWPLEQALTLPRGSDGPKNGLRWLEHNGSRKTLTEWAAQLGITPAALSYRLEAGWSLAEALTTPCDPRFARAVGF